MPAVTSLYWIRISTLASLRARVVRRPDGFSNSIGDCNTADEATLTLSSLHDEWNSLPPRVVDPQSQRGKRRADRTLGNGVVLEVSGLAVSTDVLSEQGVLPRDRRDASEDLDFFVSDVLGRERDGSLHRQQREGLQQVYRWRETTASARRSPTPWKPMPYSRFWQTSRMIPNSSK